MVNVACRSRRLRGDGGAFGGPLVGAFGGETILPGEPKRVVDGARVFGCVDTPPVYRPPTTHYRPPAVADGW
jgi:hypothetical protein